VSQCYWPRWESKAANPSFVSYKKGHLLQVRGREFFHWLFTRSYQSESVPKKSHNHYSVSLSSNFQIKIFKKNNKIHEHHEHLMNTHPQQNSSNNHNTIKNSFRNHKRNQKQVPTSNPPTHIIFFLKFIISQPQANFESELQEGVWKRDEAYRRESSTTCLSHYTSSLFRSEANFEVKEVKVLFPICVDLVRFCHILLKTSPKTWLEEWEEALDIKKFQKK